MTPCSAATVIGMVWEAETARSLEERSWRRYSRPKAADPKPSTGRSSASSTPPRMRSKRPDVALSIESLDERSSRRALGNASTTTRAAAITAPAIPKAFHGAPQRRAARTTRPASSAAKLDCDKVRSRPAHSTASARAGQYHGPARPAPEQNRGQPEHDEGEKAAVDVRIEEQRVDAEVGLELVGSDHLGIEQQLALPVLHEADRHERERQPDEHAEAPGEQPRRPLELTQQDEEERERHVEEHDLLERLGDVGRVGGLQGVEHHGARQQALEPAVARRWRRVAAEQARHEPGQRSRADHGVERDQEVGGRPSRLDRDTEGNRRDREDGEEPGAAADEHREQDQPEQRHRRAHGGQRGPLAHRLELRRVGDVGDQQHRGEHQRAEHEGRPHARSLSRARRRRPAGRPRSSPPRSSQR
jgi:hypothetical protein